MRGGVAVCERTYIYIYTYTHIVSLMILRLFIKYCQIHFLSIAPTFVYLLEKGQNEHSLHEAKGSPAHLKVCLRT